MAFTIDDGEFISLQDARNWTANYRDNSGDGAIKAQFYGKAKVAQILEQQGCVGLRVYYAIDDHGARVLVLIGTDAEGNDIESELILERGVLCPPNCGSGGGSLQG